MDKDTKHKITPILVMAAARNGATSLVNLIDTFPEVAKIEHQLHHGSHEAKLYGYYRYYGDVSETDRYIDFLYHYASEDYFQLASGDIDYHLRNRQADFFQFFFDMMDRYCLLNNKEFFVLKVEPALFTDRKTLNYLIKCLHSRYNSVKYIRMQRPLFPAVQSFLHMEGKDYNKRRKWPYRYFYMLTYVQRWFKVNELSVKFLTQREILHIDFDNFIKNRKDTQDRIRGYLGFSVDIQKVTTEKGSDFKVNTSFVSQHRTKMPVFDRYLVSAFLKLLKLFPGLVFVSHYLGAVVKKPVSPIHRKLLKYKYFRSNLLEEFKDQGAHGLLSSLGEVRDEK